MSAAPTLSAAPSSRAMSSTAPPRAAGCIIALPLQVEELLLGALHCTGQISCTI